MTPFRRLSYIIGIFAQYDTKAVNIGSHITGILDLLRSKPPVIHDDKLVPGTFLWLRQVGVHRAIAYTLSETAASHSFVGCNLVTDHSGLSRKGVLVNQSKRLRTIFVPHTSVDRWLNHANNQTRTFLHGYLEWFTFRRKAPHSELGRMVDSSAQMCAVSQNVCRFKRSEASTLLGFSMQISDMWPMTFWMSKSARPKTFQRCLTARWLWTHNPAKRMELLCKNGYDLLFFRYAGTTSMRLLWTYHRQNIIYVDSAEWYTWECNTGEDCKQGETVKSLQSFKLHWCSWNKMLYAFLFEKVLYRFDLFLKSTSAYCLWQEVTLCISVVTSKGREHISDGNQYCRKCIKKKSLVSQTLVTESSVTLAISVFSIFS